VQNAFGIRRDRPGLRVRFGLALGCVAHLAILPQESGAQIDGCRGPGEAV
jgi:hypothetical protein